jgi:hypothetical protein
MKKERALWGILFLGLLLRLFNLGGVSLWSDEAFSCWLAGRDTGELLGVLRDFDAHPPLYYMFLHFWIHLGRSELVLRLPSVLASLGSIAAAFFVFERTVGRRAATLTALFLAISPWSVRMGQEARMYPFLAIFCLLSLYFMIRAGRDDSISSWTGLILSGALALYSHYLSVFVILAENLFVFSTPLWKKGRWWASQFFVFLLFLPWIPVLSVQYSAGGRGPMLPAPEPQLLLYTLVDSAVGHTLAYRKTILIILGLALLVWLLYGLFEMRKREYFLLMFLNVFLPVSALLIMSLAGGVNLLNPKYFTFIQPFVLGILFYSLDNLWNRNKKLLAGSLLSAMLLLNLMGLWNYYVNPAFKGQDWKAATGEIRRGLQAGDALVVQSSYQYYPIWYYLGGSVPAYYPRPGDIPTLSADLRGHPRVWYVVCSLWQVDPGKKVAGWLLSRRPCIKSWIYPSPSDPMFSTINVFLLGDENR